ncbi:MAG: DUF885 family protein [Actinomycetota bacterium]|nr:DUF885 family protein [Actinomycetota bacterium]
MGARLAALHALEPSAARNGAGLHGFDGVAADLSPTGVRSALHALGRGPKLDDDHDEAVLAAAEHATRLMWGQMEIHRTNPLPHIGNLDLSGYDRPYGPAEQRMQAKLRHLAAWPDAISATLESLDSVPAVVASALSASVAGLAAGLDSLRCQGDDSVVTGALSAHRQLLKRMAEMAASGDPNPSMGAAALAELLGATEATDVDLSSLETLADAEQHRWLEVLSQGCARLAQGRETRETVTALLADHPPAGNMNLLYRQAEALMEEAARFTVESGILPDLGGTCRVGPAPPSMGWAMAMMAWNAPFESETAAWYWINPPSEDWTEQEKQEWMSVFSASTLPAITVHEVTPGHFSHGRYLRRLTSDVRRSLHSSGFIEGWAHFGEEVMLEHGFRDFDPRFAIGVAIEALTRATRLEVSIKVHRGDMNLSQAAHRFTEMAMLQGPAAMSEATRSTYDPTYGRYTWGKDEIRKLRDRAREAWGGRYSDIAFHCSLLDLGAPPLGLMDTALSKHPDRHAAC